MFKKKKNSTENVKSRDIMFCKLCLNLVPLSELFTLQSCGCYFCKECMKDYLKVNIIEGNIQQLECPSFKCKKNGILHLTEIKSLTSPELFQRYKRLKFYNDIDTNPSKFFCPQPGCETVCRLIENKNNQLFGRFMLTSQKMTCPSCSYNFCLVCKEKWHSDLTCFENNKILQELNGEQGIMFDNSIHAAIKRCPFCYLLIEKLEGCAQVMCKRCKHIFCWHCLACLDTDALFLHYERGKCKNKLGHPRASIFWHRFQVIGVFTGIGLLILIASPILLLLTPCIICCQIKLNHSTMPSSNFNEKYTGQANKTNVDEIYIEELSPKKEA